MRPIAFIYTLGIAAALFNITGLAEPYIPASEQEVLERLPANFTVGIGSDLRAMRARLAGDPSHLPNAVALARRYIEQARKESDPRYLGYAQAALAPWWTQARPPLEALLLRAIVRQANHDFEGALQDLNELLAAEPRHVQARLTRASVLQVRAAYEAAKRDCLALATLAHPIVGAACVAQVGSVNGQAQKSYTLLAHALQRAPDLPATEQQWVQGLLAEMAQSRGDALRAEQHFTAALNAAAPDAYLLAAYADFLLDQKRYRSAQVLLKDKTRADGLLLRLALAEQALNDPAAPEHIRTLEQRFSATGQRGDTLHLREEARFELALRGDHPAALALAQRNWNVQREPADARVLLEAALANKNARAAQPVLDWMQTGRVEDVQLGALRRALQELRS